jgi:hypothetical protein
VAQVASIDEEKKRVEQELKSKAAALAAARSTHTMLESLEKERSAAVTQATKLFVDKDLQVLHSVVTKTFKPEPGTIRKIIVPQKFGELVSFG